MIIIVFIFVVVHENTTAQLQDVTWLHNSRTTYKLGFRLAQH